MTPKEKREAKLALAPVVAFLTSGKTPNLPKMPRMPVMSPDAKWPHREKRGDDYGLGGLAIVARSVKPKEMKLNKKAMAAMEK